MQAAAPPRPRGAGHRGAAGGAGRGDLLRDPRDEGDRAPTPASGPTTFPYVIAAGLAVLAVGTALSAWRGGFPEREPERLGADPLDRRRPGRCRSCCSSPPASRSPPGCLFALTARGFGRGPLWLTHPDRHRLLASSIWLIFARLLHALAAGGAARAPRSLSGGRHGHLRPARARASGWRCSR